MADDLKEFGDTGLKRTNGRINEEWLRELQGRRWHKVIREMQDQDAVIGSILFAIEMLIRQVSWRVEAASEDNADMEAKEFLESNMQDMSGSWESLISEVLSFLPWGWSYHEIVYKKRNGENQDSSMNSRFKDGKIGWRKIPIRGQESLSEWKYTEDNSLEGMVQEIIGKPKTLIPIEKALLFRTTHHKQNPEGKSILRRAYRSWYYKKRIEEFEGIGVERDLAGLPLMRVPSKIMSSGANADEAAIFSACKDIVQNIRRDEQEGIILPGGVDKDGNRLFELELLGAPGNRQFDTGKIINRYDQRIATTVLADFILLGQSSVGSFALADSKTDLFATALRAWLEEIKSIFNRHAIPRLFALNSFNLERLPKLAYGDIETPNLKELGDYVKSLSSSGAELFPDTELENYLREAGNLPAKIEEE